MRFKKLAQREKIFQRRLNQAKRKSFRRTPIYQFGYRVPRTPEEAIEIDKENGDTKWQDAMTLEVNSLQEYQTFVSMGKDKFPSKEFKRIKVLFVFAVKHDGRHKARLCAGGHLTDVPLDSVYSGVVSLRSLRMVIFLAELNQLELWLSLIHI